MSMSTVHLYYCHYYCSISIRLHVNVHVPGMSCMYIPRNIIIIFILCYVLHFIIGHLGHCV
jgi:hypothetical protein